MRPRVAIKTVGCKSNYADTCELTTFLESNGVKIVPFGEEADLVIVNSCIVTHRAGRDSRRALRRGRELSSKGRAILTGCGASPLIIEKISGKGDDIVPMKAEKIWVKVKDILQIDHLPHSGCEEEGGGSPGKRARRYVNIQKGCNNRCTYCIVPLARGKSRSLPQEEIIRRIKDLDGEGVPEVVLTGTHIGAYGKELCNTSLLSGLLYKIFKATHSIRIRLSSIEVDEIDEDLISMMESEERLCNHLHIPLQSGDDEILNKMNRWYSTSEFLEATKRIKEISRDICVGTDIISGFPGEGERNFRNVLQLLTRAEIDYYHVFTYSKREGTPAAEMEEQVPEHVKRERTRILLNAGFGKKSDFVSSQVGKVLMVVCEKVDEKSGSFEGTSGNYIKVIASGSPARAGDLIPVTIEGISNGKAKGTTRGRNSLHH